ncbi:cation:proton antiporter, partial [uncultured Sphingobium sp.]|uniref:cation:proton antiporter n=1 Tax=uncultured Sphingobium sp. TaxID=316087 RepID=UPI00260C3C77
TDVSAELGQLARLCSVPHVAVLQHGERGDPGHLAAYDSAVGLLAPYSERIEQHDRPAYLRRKTHYASGVGIDCSPFPTKREARRKLGLGEEDEIVLVIAGGGELTPVAAVGALAWTVLGGLAAGAGVAFLLLKLAGRTDDHLVEITLTTIIAWGSFLLAEHVKASGVFAALAAGVIVGNLGWRRAISENGRGHVLGFWEYAAFLANSLLFLMIGSHEAHQPLALVSGALAVVIALTLVGRAAAVYPIALLFRPTRLRLPGPYQHVLLWGGLRGAVGLALALAVPESVPERGQIIVLAFGVVAFSIFLQGLTMPPLLRRWKLTGQDDPDDAPSA